MAVVLRLARGGCKHRPFYRLMAADSRLASTGKYIEVLGQYNPTPSGQEKEMNLDMNRINHWLEKGALPSDRVKSILKKAKKLN